MTELLFCPCGISVLCEKQEQYPPRCLDHKQMSIYEIKREEKPQIPLYTPRRKIRLDCQYCGVEVIRDVSMKNRKATCEKCKEQKKAEYGKKWRKRNVDNWV